MNSGTKLQLEARMEMILCIQKDIGRGWRTCDITIEEEQANCGQGFDTSFSPASKEKIGDRKGILCNAIIVGQPWFEQRIQYKQERK